MPPTISARPAPNAAAAAYTPIGTARRSFGKESLMIDIAAGERGLADADGDARQEQLNETGREPTRSSRRAPQRCAGRDQPRREVRSASQPSGRPMAA